VREKNILLEGNFCPTRLVLNERGNLFLKLLLALNRPETATNNKIVQQITEISNMSLRDFRGTPSSVIKQPFPGTRSH
jgi:hypothetical protein